MRIFVRTFNRFINSKSGQPLPEGQYRGTPEWITFQNLLIECLKELGHELKIHKERGAFIDDDPLWKAGCDKFIYVHQTKLEIPQGDLFWMQMHMRELFTIDTNGWGADASNNDFKLGDVDAKEAKEFCEAKSRNLCETGQSKCEQPKDTSNTPESFILVPLQIPRDYTIKNHSPIRVHYFIDSLMSWAEESQTHICVKMHPNNRMDRDLHEAVDDGAKQSEYVHKAEGNIHELIRRSTGLFVINSGTGFESLIHGKPVATFGACDYSRATWNADIRRIKEAYDFLCSYQESERQIGYEFVYWYYRKHGYDVNASDTKERLIQYLKENL